MKREEEIEQAAYDICEETPCDYHIFIKGAQWADEHPITGEQIVAMKGHIQFLERKLAECDKMYRELQQQSPWISVGDRLPEQGQFIVAYGHYREDSEDSWYGLGKYKVSGATFEGMKYWIPIPELPKGE